MYNEIRKLDPMLIPIPEVEDWKDLWLGEGENDNAAELGEGDPREDAAPHARQHVPWPLNPDI